MAREVCEFCGESSCDVDHGKIVKVYFCPKCRSKDVGFIFQWRNIFGLLPKMRCKKCKYEASVFPILVIPENKLKQHARKRKKK
jgi:hypothetical protein